MKRTWTGTGFEPGPLIEGDNEMLGRELFADEENLDWHGIRTRTTELGWISKLQSSCLLAL